MKREKRKCRIFFIALASVVSFYIGILKTHQENRNDQKNVDLINGETNIFRPLKLVSIEEIQSVATYNCDQSNKGNKYPDDIIRGGHPAA